MNRRHILTIAVLLVSAVGFLGCGSPVQFLSQGSPYRARPADSPVDVIQGPLQRPHAVIGTLRLAHRIRPGYGETSALDQAVEQILVRARRIGADAIVDVQREASTDADAGETFFVSARAVRYLQRVDVVRHEVGY